MIGDISCGRTVDGPFEYKGMGYYALRGHCHGPFADWAAAMMVFTEARNAHMHACEGCDRPELCAIIKPHTRPCDPRPASRVEDGRHLLSC